MKPRLIGKWLAAVAAACATWAAVDAGYARASIVERVVAVVGERPILLSELRHRARPHQYRILATTPDATRQAALETELYRDLLNRMIDDRLEEQAADKAHLTVSPDEIDAALRNIANTARIAVKDLVTEAKKQGLSEQDYRDELRRQVLEGKLVNLRVRGRVRVTDQDARAAYARVLKEAEKEQPVDVGILALRILPGSTAEQMKARETFAADLTAQARAGKDFCALVKSYSDDQSTRETCGSNGPQPLARLVPELQDALRTMKTGDVSDPVRIGNEAILIVRLAHDVAIPSFEQVRDQMMERAYGEQMERQRKQWLLELRRGIYIDVRL